LRTATEVKRDAMRVALDGAAGREISFNLRGYALNYGDAATVHKAQGAMAKVQWFRFPADSQRYLH
jgi:hypothetical protein